MYNILYIKMHTTKKKHNISIHKKKTDSIKSQKSENAVIVIKTPAKLR